MSSKQPRKIAQKNGAKAAGTRSPAGIANSARNSLKYGLNCPELVLSNESPEQFRELHETYIQKFEPAEGVEMKLVEEMVAAKWRRQRGWIMQTTALDLEMVSQRKEFKDYDKQRERLPHISPASCMALSLTAIAGKENTWELLKRYETSFARIHDRAMKSLYRLRAESKLQNDPESHPPAAGHPAAKPALTLCHISEISKLQNDPDCPDSAGETPAKPAPYPQPGDPDIEIAERP